MKINAFSREACLMCIKVVLQKIFFIKIFHFLREGSITLQQNITGYWILTEMQIFHSFAVDCGESSKGWYFYYLLTELTSKLMGCHTPYNSITKTGLKLE